VIVRRSVTSVAVLALAASLVVACGNNKDEDDGAAPPTASVAATPAPTPAPTPTPAQTTQVMPEGTTPAGGSRVQTELEGRTDGVPGKPLAVTGARATLQHPTAWTAAPPVNGVVVAKPADDKARIAAIAFTGDPVAKVTEAATAAGLTGCTWQAPVTLAAIGKDKLPGTGADGTCMRGTVKTAAAWVATPGEGLAVVGGWDDPAGDANGVFGAMRTIAKAGTGDASGIKACCQALSQNAKSAPPFQQGAYIAAAGACNSLAANPQGRQSLAQIRAMLAGAGVPAACK
jgi:hypothetical protein